MFLVALPFDRRLNRERAVLLDIDRAADRRIIAAVKHVAVRRERHREGCGRAVAEVERKSALTGIGDRVRRRLGKRGCQNVLRPGSLICPVVACGQNHVIAVLHLGQIRLGIETLRIGGLQKFRCVRLGDKVRLTRSVQKIDRIGILREEIAILGGAFALGERDLEIVRAGERRRRLRERRGGRDYAVQEFCDVAVRRRGVGLAHNVTDGHAGRRIGRDRLFVRMDIAVHADIARDEQDKDQDDHKKTVLFHACASLPSDTFSLYCTKSARGRQVTLEKCRRISPRCAF